MSAQNIQSAPAQSSPRFQLNLRHVSLLLVVFGVIISGYLTYVKATDVPMICTADGPFQCDVVQNSAYAELTFPVLGEVPIAYLGLATYLVIGALLLLENRVPFLQENGLIITFGIVFFAFLYSMYLVYVQGVLLQAWCQWCLMHEINMTAMFVVFLFRLRNYFAVE